MAKADDDVAAWNWRRRAPRDGTQISSSAVDRNSLQVSWLGSTCAFLGLSAQELDPQRNRIEDKPTVSPGCW